MSEFVNVETANLEGRALDWAVAIAEGWAPDRPQDGQLKKNGIIALAGHHKPDGTKRYSFSPSTSWICGGPLIDKYHFDFTFERLGLVYAYPCDEAGKQVIHIYNDDHRARYGDTHLIAMCRALVHWKLGEVVNVPAALLEVTP